MDRDFTTETGLDATAALLALQDGDGVGCDLLLNAIAGNPVPADELREAVQRARGRLRRIVPQESVAAVSEAERILKEEE